MQVIQTRHGQTLYRAADGTVYNRPLAVEQARDVSKPQAPARPAPQPAPTPRQQATRGFTPRQAAVHEGGHSYGAWLGKITIVDVVCDFDGGKFVTRTAGDPDYFSDLVHIALGPMAENALAPGGNDAWGKASASVQHGDWFDAGYVLGQLPADKRSAVWANVAEWCEEVLEDDLGRRTILRLADALLARGRLTGDDVEAIILGAGPSTTSQPARPVAAAPRGITAAQIADVLYPKLPTRAEDWRPTRPGAWN